MKDQASPLVLLEGQCAGAAMCPLSDIQAGTTVCIKHLSTSPEVSGRLRELGFYEERRIKLLAREASYICQVCNARLGLSAKLAESIYVEPLPGPAHAKRSSTCKP